MKSSAQSFSKIASTLLFQQIGLEIGTFQSSICAYKKNIFWEIVFLANLSGVFSGKALEK